MLLAGDKLKWRAAARRLHFSTLEVDYVVNADPIAWLDHDHLEAPSRCSRLTGSPQGFRRDARPAAFSERYFALLKLLGDTKHDLFGLLPLELQGRCVENSRCRIVHAQQRIAIRP